MKNNLILIILLMSVFLTGCSGTLLEIGVLEEVPPEPGRYDPTFKLDPVYKFKLMIEEGWDLKVSEGQLVFIKETENSIETYKPKDNDTND